MRTKKTLYGSICFFLVLLFVSASVHAQTYPNCRRNQITAVLPNNPASMPYYNAFIQNVVQNIQGVTLMVPWNTLETSQGVYSVGLSALDGTINSFLAATATINPTIAINLIVAPVQEPGSNGGNNTWTPSYVFSVSYSNSIPAPPQDVVYGPAYIGAEGIGTCNCIPSVGTYSNAASPAYTCPITGTRYTFDPTGQPVVTEAPFQLAYQKLIDTVINHYSHAGQTIYGTTVPQIGYIRFGLVQNGEITPLNIAAWPNYGGSLSNFETQIDNYADQMMTYINNATVNATGPYPPRELADFHELNSAVPPAQYEASVAVTAGKMGIGSNSLKITDLTGFPNDASQDWGNIFNQWQGSKVNDSFVTLNMQLFALSDPSCTLNACPAGSNGEGSLADLLPFINGGNSDGIVVNNFEAFPCDLLLAFAPATTYSTTGCHTSDGTGTPAYTNYSSAYATAFAKYAAGFTLTASCANPICPGGTSTLTSIFTNSTTATYTYAWAGTELVTSSSPTVTATPTTTSTYTLTVTASPGSGCVAGTATTVATVNLPPTASITSTIPASLCSGTSTISFSYTNGAGSFTDYAWSGSDGSSGTTATPAITVTPTLASTTYSVTANTSAPGCTGTAVATTTVTKAALPSVSFTVNPASVCVNGTATITATASGGTGTQTYGWSGPGIGTVSGNSTPPSAFTPSVATSSGVYSVTYSSTGQGCTQAQATNTITVNALPTASITSTTPTALCSGNATISLTNAGGMGSFVNYAWSGSDGSSGTSATSPVTVTPTITSTTYSVTANTSAPGCTGIAYATTTVMKAALPSVSFTVNPATICVNGTTTITATGSGGTGTQTYGWSGPGIGTVSGNSTAPTAFTPSVTTSSGVYSVTYSSTGQGCTQAQATNTITVNALPTASITSTTPTALCSGNATISLTNAGGAGSFVNYAWSGSDGSSGSSATSPVTVTPTTTTTTYSVTANTSAPGCTGTAYVTTTVTKAALPSVSFTVNPATICVNGTTTITATGNGGTGTQTYGWSGPGIGTISGNSTPPSAFTPSVTTSSGIYSVTYSSTGQGCTQAIATNTVTVDPLPVPSVSPAYTTICTGSVALTPSYTSGAGSLIDYKWSTSSGHTNTSSGVVLVDPTSYSTFSVTVNTSGPGCTGTAIAIATVNVHCGGRDAEIVLTLTNNSPVCFLCPVSLSCSATGGNGNYKYTWTGDDEAGMPPIVTTANITATPTTAGDHVYTVIVTDDDGATASGTTIVTVSPNDGINSTTGIAGAANLMWALYPNPAKDAVSITATSYDKEDVQFEVNDLTGRTLKTTLLTLNGTQTITMNVNELPSGTFFISLYRNGVLYDTKKLVLIK